MEVVVRCPECRGEDTYWRETGSLFCSSCKQTFIDIKKGLPETWPTIVSMSASSADSPDSSLFKSIEFDGYGNVTKVIKDNDDLNERYWDEQHQEQSAPNCPECSSNKTFWQRSGNLACIMCKKVYEDINRFRIMKETEVLSVQLKDSGARREFESGAVRDISEGKGRCDLLPLTVIELLLPCKSRDILTAIELFKSNKDVTELTYAIQTFIEHEETNVFTMLLEVSKHFEAGASKYGENNWKKGIPLHCYLDSAVRHYLKHLRGDTDEPHDRAFVWNLLCGIWTFEHKPELDDVEKDLAN